MILENIFIAIVLGFTGGITPGPIILLSFAEILRSPKQGLVNGGMYLLFAGLTEFCVALFLIYTSSWLSIPNIVFHFLAIFGIAILIFLAINILKINKIEYKEQKKQIQIKHIIGLMLFNCPMWLFWLSVCLPAAFRLGTQIRHGEYLFAIIFEISMMFGLAIMLFGFNSFRKFFTNERIIKRIFLILSSLLFLIALKILSSEVLFFYKLYAN